MYTGDTAQLIEEGSAAIQLARRGSAVPIRREVFDVIVIGAGQAGLSVAYHLSQSNETRFVILEANARIGDSWRKRWDSLRLFTPASFDGLDGMPFPAPAGYFPTKDEMASYLEAYATRFRLPVRTGVRVERLFEREGRYVVTTGGSGARGAAGRRCHGKIPAAQASRVRITTVRHNYATAFECLPKCLATPARECPSDRCRKLRCGHSPRGRAQRSRGVACGPQSG